jgi:AraC-like DNA-binding protein
VLALSQQVVGRLAQEPPGRRVWMRLLALELLLLVQRDWDRPLELTPALADSFEALAGAVGLVFESRRMVSTAEAAAACGMSGTAFRRRFRDLMGITFAKFALRHRLSQAAVQLLRTEHPLKAVAVAWGFTDDSHFHRAFLRHYACSPGEYRRRRRSGAGPRGTRRGRSAQPRRSR